MGTPVPDDPSEYEDAKHYCVTFHVFESGGDPNKCDGDYIMPCRVCMTGADIKQWLASGEECKDNRHPCDPGLWGSHRMICTTGAYDTLEQCNDACPRIPPP